MLKRSFASCSVFVSVAFSALPGSAANFGVTEKFWGNATTIGSSFAWAIDRANATAGHDTD